MQDELRAADVTLAPIPGAANLSNKSTKRVERPLLFKHLQTLRLHQEEGRPDSAPVIEQNVLQLQYGLVQIASL